MEREQVMSNGGVVNRRTKVFEFADDETTSYAILSHRWTQEVDYRRSSTWQRWKRTNKMRSVNGLDTRRSLLAVNRRRRMSSSGCGSIRAASTSEAAQSCPRLSIPCIGGMKTRGCAMRTFTTSAHPFLVDPAGRCIPISTAGRSGSHVGGRYRR
ncbi:hypothetical protein SCLCIDRAFT_1157979 [Scleroderma citrinum Foug A]|uniref:Uncharacterized protein n=1 Tax=Scleroderma citrinum Foug A TaxID=1036808 RepID=A0A0C3DYQ8_9AGAM|nr:hypothetical protein SCLCIDRAFT_1157979 [Scleroderma citrinum Foug A]